MRQQKGCTKTTIVIAVLLLMGIVGYLFFTKGSLENKENKNTGTPINIPTDNDTPQAEPEPTADSSAKPDLATIFALDEKRAGTQIFYSKNLGVGFTYLPFDFKPTVEINESENKIMVDGSDGQWLEVFDKDPNISLAQAIEQRFLSGYNPTDCFVKVSDYSESFQATQQELVDYNKAYINFPTTPNAPDAPWWENADKCPSVYTTTNGIAYFLYNKNVPSKYLFVSIGQYSAASDGSSLTDPNYNWDRSIRILQ